MKATDLLEKQHRTVEGLFKKLEGGGGDIPALLKELAADLAAHMIVEQEIFYPAVLKVKEDLVLEGYEEHAAAEGALKRLLKTSPKDVTFKAKVTVLKELIEHHVKEEEGDLFPKVEKALGAERLTELGRKMKPLFDEMHDAGHERAMTRSHKTAGDKGAHRAESAES